MHDSGTIFAMPSCGWRRITHHRYSGEEASALQKYVSNISTTNTTTNEHNLEKILRAFIYCNTVSFVSAIKPQTQTRQSLPSLPVRTTKLCIRAHTPRHHGSGLRPLPAIQSSYHHALNAKFSVIRTEHTPPKDIDVTFSIENDHGPSSTIHPPHLKVLVEFSRPP